MAVEAGRIEGTSSCDTCRVSRAPGLRAAGKGDNKTIRSATLSEICHEMEQ